MSAIPESDRETVATRSQGRCERCAGRASEVHHRQRRREGGHGAANLTHLCGVCHRWAHSNPISARNEGFIVSMALDPATTPLRHLSLGWAIPTADGGWVSPEKGTQDAQ